MATKNEKAANNEADANVKNEKIKTEEEMTTNKETSGTGPKNMASMLMATVVAIPSMMIAAYLLAPQQLISDFSSLSTSGDARSNVNYEQQQMPAHANAENWNRNQEPEWVAVQRAEMEKRRSEFEKKNADLYAKNRVSPEPPQWVKDQQALMQKEQAKYQQEWEQRSAQMANNRNQPRPGYMNNPAMNMYPQNQVPAYGYAQNPAPYYNGYTQPVNPYQYNNGPYTGPQQAPYLQNGYPY